MAWRRSKKTHSDDATAATRAEQMQTTDAAVVEVPTVVEMAAMEKRAHQPFARSGRVEEIMMQRYGVRKADFAPAWTRWVHTKFGHIGGAVVFGLCFVVAWPVLAMVGAALVQITAQNIMTAIPTVIAETFQVPPSALTSTLDRFYFSWLTPVWVCTAALFIVLACVMGWATKRAVEFTTVCAHGLFSGYHTTLAENLAERKARKAARGVRDNSADDVSESAALD